MTFTASIPSHLDTPEELLQAMRDLRQQVDRDSRQTFARWRPSIQRRGFLPGAVNLAAYLALREHDLRELQTALTPWGLSSLGRSEARVMASLDAVIATLAALAGEANPPRPQRLNRFFQGDRLLRFNTDQVFGPPPPQRRVRVMVTFPSEAARDEAWVRDMVRRGMDVARINTAHDHEGAWGQMIASIRKAAQIEGRNVRVFMDLAGPKVRTAEIHQPDNKKQRLEADDLILLTRKKPDKDLPYEFQVQSAVPEPLDQVAVGDPVWFDDGQMQTVVTQLTPEGAVLRVVRVGKGGYRLKREKGMNFPETDLRLSPLSPADRDALDFVARHADQVGYSFVQERSDIALLQELLAQRMERPDRIALIAKIETPRAVRNLPELIVQGAGRQPFGLMIARGDLAVELGFERMAEMQEQILWLAEAAHVPVIWATQVLEKFVKQGVPSRSEMTDAAMSSRAECVMLNKGPYAGEAVSLLNDVLHRMRDHYHKKAPQLRALRSWKDSSRPAD